MRIRNLRSFQFFYGYAGPDNKGWSLKPNQLSPELPTRRFYDKKLQTDWRAKKIEIALNACDRAILGSDADFIDVVQTLAPASPEPAATAAAAVAAPAAAETAVTEACDTTTFSPAETASSETVPADPDPTDTDPKKADTAGLTKCTNCDKTNYLQLDTRVGLVLCRYCRSAISKKITEATASGASAPYQIAEPIAPVGPVPEAPIVPPTVVEDEVIEPPEPEADVVTPPDPRLEPRPEPRLVHVKLPTGESVAVTPESAASLRYSVNARVTPKPTASVNSFFSGLEVGAK